MHETYNTKVFIKNIFSFPFAIHKKQMLTIKEHIKNKSKTSKSIYEMAKTKLNLSYYIIPSRITLY